MRHQDGDGRSAGKQRRPFQNRGQSDAAGLWLYGLHALRAALANPQRLCHRCVLTRQAAEQLGTAVPRQLEVRIANSDEISRLLPAGAVHQGAALACDPLPRRPLVDILERDGRKVVLVLDQISDPQNVGAILRSAAAFDAAGVIVQDRHAPPESGTLAKAASGGLDLVPYLPVVNIARAVEELGEAGFWRIALVADSDRGLAEAKGPGDLALVLGSEGAGIRRLVRARCDDEASIPIRGSMQSLNVSNATAIALYECQRM
ncbi:MAG TPA: 23S rRNA (guanosine(2251)-2'-O)-methyltransferase RlmB [Rhizomicrobium sp.]|jgi:23S rRNA (guanosine2251-2'-O)-methyltransferase